MTSPPFRVETVPVRRTGRGPIVAAVLAALLVAVSIVKPWAGSESANSRQASALPSPAPQAAAVDAPDRASSTPAPQAAEGLADVGPAPLALGQMNCGTSDWRIVTLGDFGRWTVRTWTAITPVEAIGPDDSSIPELALGDADVAGLGACAPSSSRDTPGHGSRIVAAWRTSAGIPSGGGPSATGSPRGTVGGGTAAGGEAGGGTVGGGTAGGPAGRTPSSTATPSSATPVPTFESLTLAQLDRLPSGGPAAARSRVPKSVTELFRPVPASPGGRWPAGRYVLLLASPDAGPDRWIGVVIGAEGW